VRRSFRVGRSTFGVRTTSARFGSWLDDTLSAYRIDEELEPEYSIVIDGGHDESASSGRRFHILWQGVGQVTRTLHLPTLARSFLAELEARLLAELDDAVYVHQAPVRSGSVTVLVPAWFVAYIQAAGRRVDRAGLVLPDRRWAALDPTTGVVLPVPPLLDVPRDAVAALEPWADVEPPTRWDPREPFVADAAVTYVEGMTTVDLGGRAAALHRLARETANIQRLGGTAIRGLARAVEHARTYELGLGRPAQMVDALAAVVAHEHRHDDAPHDRGAEHTPHEHREEAMHGRT
jgi:hypothetical protein